MTRKTFVGKVVSNKMEKTVVVEISRSIQHPIYKKIMKRSKRIKADLPAGSQGANGKELSVGQYVKIESTKPISRDKHFKVIEVLKEGTRG